MLAVDLLVARERFECSLRPENTPLDELREILRADRDSLAVGPLTDSNLRQCLGGCLEAPQRRATLLVLLSHRSLDLMKRGRRVARQASCVGKSVHGNKQQQATNRAPPMSRSARGPGRFSSPCPVPSQRAATSGAKSLKQKSACTRATVTEDKNRQGSEVG